MFMFLLNNIVNYFKNEINTQNATLIFNKQIEQNKFS